MPEISVVICERCAQQCKEFTNELQTGLDLLIGDVLEDHGISIEREKCLQYCPLGARIDIRSGDDTHLFAEDDYVGAKQVYAHGCNPSMITDFIKTHYATLFD